jgi:chitinase
MRKKLLLLLFLGSCAQQLDEHPQAQQSRWITGYYPLWAVCTMPPSAIDYNALSHIIHFAANVDSTAPYFGPLVRGGDSAAIEWGVGECVGPHQADLISLAHHNNVKVLLGVAALGGLGGVGANTMNYVSSDVRRTRTFVDAVLAYARRKGYDGIDIDWEFVGADQRENFVRLITALRNSLDSWNPKGILTLAIPGFTGTWIGYDVPTMNAKADQINLMTYDMAHEGNQYSGFNSPIYRPNYPNYEGWTLSGDNPTWGGPKAWIAAGLDPSRMAIGIPFYCWIWPGNDAPGEIRAGWPSQLRYLEALEKKDASTYHWDDIAKVPWLGGTDSRGNKFFISYDDSLSVTAKVAYAKNLNLSGIMVYELWSGNLPSNPPNERDPLLHAVKRAWDSLNPAPVAK